MIELKTPRECIGDNLPCTSDPDRGFLRNREYLLCNRIKRLEFGRTAVARLLARFDNALYREMELLGATQKRRKALEQATRTRPQAGMPVPPVHGGSRQAAEEKPPQAKEEAKAAGEAGRRTYPGSGELVMRDSAQTCGPFEFESFQEVRRIK